MKYRKLTIVITHKKITLRMLYIYMLLYKLSILKFKGIQYQIQECLAKILQLSMKPQS